jgi:hypothetical protein
VSRTSDAQSSSKSGASFSQASQFMAFDDVELDDDVDEEMSVDNLQFMITSVRISTCLLN